VNVKFLVNVFGSSVYSISLAVEEELINSIEPILGGTFMAAVGIAFITKALGPPSELKFYPDRKLKGPPITGRKAKALGLCLGTAAVIFGSMSIWSGLWRLMFTK
jgi:hypothetical protein